MAAPQTTRELAEQTYRDYVTVGVPASGAHNPPKNDIRELFARLPELIIEDVTLSVATSGGDFDEPGAAMEWLADKRIARGVAVTITLANGTYEITKAIRGHIDGRRIMWQNDGVDGDPLVGADFADLDEDWVIDSVTGISEESRTANKTAAEAIVRAKFGVIFECDGTVASVVCCDGMHAGNWVNAPCLFINTGDEEEGASVGVTTGSGTASNIGDGDGGVAIFPGSCFFGFNNANHLTDYGGIINMEGGLSLFGLDDCVRADFRGQFYGEDAIIIGAGFFGYRSNHGGSAYFETAYVRGCNTGVQIDNTPGMAWMHGSDIQFNFRGSQAQYGGSLKIASHARFVGFSTAASGNGATATITWDGDETLEVGQSIIVIGLDPEGYNGTHPITASAPGSVSFASTETGAQVDPANLFLSIPAKVKNNARVQVYASNGGTIDARRLDAESTELFANDGTPGQEPSFGVQLEFAGEIDIDDGTVTGHGDRDVYQTGGAISALNATVGSAETVGNRTLIKNPLTSVYTVLGDFPHVRVHTAAGGANFLQDDDILIVNKDSGAATAISINLNLNFQGREVVVKDGKGDAASNNITITAGDSKLIDGGANYVISTNRGKVRMVYSEALDGWSVIGT